MVNISNAVSTVTSSGFLMSTGLVVGGVLGAQLVTDFARDNLYDPSQPGLEAIYPVAGAIITMAVLPRQYGNPLALGMAGSAGITVAESLDLIEA